MSSSYPSSNHAIHGSANGSSSSSAPDPLPSISSHSAAANTAAAADQQALSTSRTLAYVANPTASHVQHRHRSVKQAKASHAADIKVFLDNFDAIMARYEK
ncbi:hypothetical protein V8E51_019023 [Hyaloscypha variabilis]